MPLFALANMAISLNGSLGTGLSSTLSLGIIAGLVLGKPLGIFLFSFLAHKTRIASLPSGTSYKQLFGVGMLGGIGFTMSIFTATLAYAVTAYQTNAKIAIMTGSVLSALAGLYFLKRIFSGSPAVAGHTEKEKQKRVQQDRIGSLPEIA
ncbi:Na+:H+ antiporter, NhaA family [Arachidicoccus rhizosphaerae]|uniref:Na+:H+ antiporter, NhaA family n=1 Tax=Arachidicoccus rhizosphaerae TaxID=551991 RepID=A0A1H4CUV0_9BACT|nr:Na+:H+ antiporter, NhaA family [Arachidicoccus rhizosphaerae]